MIFQTSEKESRVQILFFTWINVLFFATALFPTFFLSPMKKYSAQFVSPSIASLDLDRKQFGESDSKRLPKFIKIFVIVNFSNSRLWKKVFCIRFSVRIMPFSVHLMQIYTLINIYQNLRIFMPFFTRFWLDLCLLWFFKIDRIMWCFFYFSPVPDVYTFCWIICHFYLAETSVIWVDRDEKLARSDSPVLWIT